MAAQTVKNRGGAPSFLKMAVERLSKCGYGLPDPSIAPIESCGDAVTFMGVMDLYCPKVCSSEDPPKDGLPMCAPDQDAHSPTTCGENSNADKCRDFLHKMVAEAGPLIEQVSTCTDALASVASSYSSPWSIALHSTEVGEQCGYNIPFPQNLPMDCVGSYMVFMNSMREISKVCTNCFVGLPNHFSTRQDCEDDLQKSANMADAIFDAKAQCTAEEFTTGPWASWHLQVSTEMDFKSHLASQGYLCGWSGSAGMRKENAIVPQMEVRGCASWRAGEALSIHTSLTRSGAGSEGVAKALASRQSAEL